MKNFSIPILLSIFFISMTANVISHELHQAVQSEQVIFHAWWEEKGTDCIIRFLPKDSLDPVAFQIDNGIPITKDDFLEVYREEKYTGLFSNKSYIYHLTYKDDNAKVSTSKIIFINKKASQSFQYALQKFGIN